MEKTQPIQMPWTRGTTN